MSFHPSYFATPLDAFVVTRGTISMIPKVKLCIVSECYRCQRGVIPLQLVLPTPSFALKWAVLYWLCGF